MRTLVLRPGLEVWVLEWLDGQCADRYEKPLDTCWETAAAWSVRTETLIILLHNGGEGRLRRERHWGPKGEQQVRTCVVPFMRFTRRLERVEKWKADGR